MRSLNVVTLKDPLPLSSKLWELCGQLGRSFLLTSIALLLVIGMGFLIQTLVLQLNGPRSALEESSLRRLMILTEDGERLKSEIRVLQSRIEESMGHETFSIPTKDNDD